MTVTSSDLEAGFVVTKQYRRFQEFCDACRTYRYIGLCYGPPGVGKTLSARHYANWDQIASYNKYMSSCGVKLRDVIGSNVILYTATVTNTPRHVAEDIDALRNTLRNFLLEDLYGVIAEDVQNPTLSDPQEG